MIDFLVEWFPFIAKGVTTTLGLWALAITLGFVVSLVLLWGRLYAGRVFYWVATAYVEVFRGTPMLVQLFFIYFGLPEVGVVLDPFTCAVVAIGLNSAAYQAEYFRGAVLSLPAGQMTAARALGMSRFQAFRKIILPQASRRAIPQWSNEVIVELKYTSIAYAIGVTEMTALAEQAGYQTFRFLEAFLVVAAIYLVLTGTIAFILERVERAVYVPGLTYRNQSP
jgi:polar amino acid transport system permease protein